jgi:hypothetical protein
MLVDNPSPFSLSNPFIFFNLIHSIHWMSLGMDILQAYSDNGRWYARIQHRKAVNRQPVNSTAVNFTFYDYDRWKNERNTYVFHFRQLFSSTINIGRRRKKPLHFYILTVWLSCVLARSNLQKPSASVECDEGRSRPDKRLDDNSRRTSRLAHSLFS